MLWSGRIALMIIMTATILTHSSADGKPVTEMRSKFSSPFTSEPHSEDNNIRHSRSRSNRRNKYGLKCKKRLDLSPVSIKLKNVIDRYNSKWREVQLFYAPVEACVPDKCGETLIPAYLLPKAFKCAKIRNCKHLKKKILKTLSRFHAGVRYFAERFHNLTVTHQKQGRKINGSRLKLLNQFKTDLQMLNIEIESLVTKKRLKNFHQQKTSSAMVSSEWEISRTYQTDLLINERMTIQNSKKFLADWKKKLKNVFRCW